MPYILTGFKQDLGFRVFAFAHVELAAQRTEHTVRADLSLSRKYGIPMQELPLLCRELLERRGDTTGAGEVTFTEDDMSACARTRTAAKELAASRKRPPRRPSGENLGAAWRSPQVR
jgi:hypothetical protein